MEGCWNNTDRRFPKYHGETLFLFRFSPHHKSQVFWPGIEPVRPPRQTCQITKNYKSMNYPLKALGLWPGVYCKCCINLTSFSLWHT